MLIDPLHTSLRPALSHYMFHYITTTSSTWITWFITYTTQYNYMHCMALYFLSPWSRVSCATLHTQGDSPLKRRWSSRLSLSAATIDKGLAREGHPQLPWTWKHRSRVIQNNQAPHLFLCLTFKWLNPDHREMKNGLFASRSSRNKKWIGWQWLHPAHWENKRKMNRLQPAHREKKNGLVASRP